MIAVKTRFDGHQIEIPPALRSASPGEVVVVFDEAPADPGRPDRVASIWDAFGKAPIPRDADDLDARLRADREEWGER